MQSMLQAKEPCLLVVAGPPVEGVRPRCKSFLGEILWFTIEPLLYNKALKRERFSSNGDEGEVGGRDVVGVTSQKMKSR